MYEATATVCVNLMYPAVPAVKSTDVNRTAKFRSIARDEFVRTNRRAIATMFVRPSVCLSVWDGHAL